MGYDPFFPLLALLVLAAAMPAQEAGAGEEQEKAGGARWPITPEITVFGNMLGTASDEGENEEHNRFSLRDVEFDFGARLTDYARAHALIDIGEELETNSSGDLESEVHVEVNEAFLTLHTEEDRLTLRAGKFRLPVARANTWHTHALPQASRPLALQAFFGGEGFASAGAELAGRTREGLGLELGVVNADGGEESPLFSDPGADPAGYAVFGRRWRALGGEVDLAAGALVGPTAAAGGQALLLSGRFGWERLEREDDGEPGLVLLGEAFWAENDVEDPMLGAFLHESVGGYAYAEARPWHDVHFGVRGDFTEYPDVGARGVGDQDWGVSPYATWYLDDAVRLRFEYQHLATQTMGDWQTEEVFRLELTFAFGASGLRDPHDHR